MGKKKSWLGWVKKLFTCSEKTKRGNKDWKWKLGRFEVSQYPALLETRKRRITLCEATEEQRKHALDVAVAATAAAEAAVAAAEAAAVVVRLTAAPESRGNFRNLDPVSAAIKIQSAYRAHLARKALRALKGVVKLQAIVRGRAVRRQMNLTLKHMRLDSIRKSKACGRASQERHEFSKDHEKRTLSEPRKKVQEKEQKLEVGSQGAWISVLSKEDLDMVWLKKQEAAMKRERMKKYSSSYREGVNGNITLRDLLTKKEQGARSCRVAEPREGREASKRIAHLNRQSKQNNNEFTLARNSFSHEKWDPFMIPVSPDFPAYMASTESTKAKTRSMSIPKQRVGFWDNCLETNYPHNKNRLSLWSSYDGESLWRY